MSWALSFRFARNFAPLYTAASTQARWAPVGGEEARSDFLYGPGIVSAIDRSHRHLADATLGIVGLGNIGAEIARRALAFGMRVIAVDPVRTEAPSGVCALWPVSRLPQAVGRKRLCGDRRAAHARRRQSCFAARNYGKCGRAPS